MMIRPKISELFLTYEQKNSSIYDLYEMLVSLADLPQACVVRGRRIIAGDEPIRRKSSGRSNDTVPTFKAAPHRWIMLDFDKVPLRIDAADPVSDFLTTRFVPLCPEFSGSTYVIDLASKHGFREEGDVLVADPSVGSFHVWYWLDQPADNASLAAWARTLRCLHVDSSMFQTVQIHFTAPPTFEGMNDPLAGRRLKLVVGKRNSVPFSPPPFALPATDTEWARKANAKPMREFVPNPRFAELYCAAAVGGRFFDYMLRVAMQALRHGFNPSASDIEELGLVMSRAVDPLKMRPASLREATNALRQAQQNISAGIESPVNRVPEAQGMICEYIAAKCGAGKSKQALAEIAHREGRWVYACDTMEGVEERRREFEAQFSGVQRIAWQVESAYTNYGQRRGITVSGQVRSIKNNFDSDRRRNKVLFITHRALATIDWSEWSGYHLICDEEPAAVQMSSIYLDEIAESVLKKYVTLLIKDGTSVLDGSNYVVQLTPEGKKLAALKGSSTAFPRIKEICEIIASPNAMTCVSIEDWDKSVPRDLSFWCVANASAISYFSSRLFMSDDFENSRLFRIWEATQNVTWVRREFSSQRPPRNVPTCKRSIVLYFSVDNPSFSGFNNDDYKSFANALKYLSSLDRSMLIATNERVYSRLKSKRVAMPSRAVCVTPMQRGRNDLAHHDFLVFLSALNVNGQASNIFLRQFGMDYHDVLCAIQHHAAWQFANRGCIRDWDASTVQTTVVWSKGEAEYIAARFGCQAVQIRGDDGMLVVDRVKRKPGRPKSPCAMSNSQRMRAYRMRKKLHGGSLCDNVNDAHKVELCEDHNVM